MSAGREHEVETPRKSSSKRRDPQGEPHCYLLTSVLGFSFLLRPSSFPFPAYNEALVLHKPVQGAFCSLTPKSLVQNSQPDDTLLKGNALLACSRLKVSLARVLSRQTLIWLKLLLPLAAGCIDYLSPSLSPRTDRRHPNRCKEHKGWVARGSGNVSVRDLKSKMLRVSAQDLLWNLSSFRGRGRQ